MADVSQHDNRATARQLQHNGYGTTAANQRDSYTPQQLQNGRYIQRASYSAILAATAQHLTHALRGILSFYVSRTLENTPPLLEGIAHRPYSFQARHLHHNFYGETANLCVDLLAPLDTARELGVPLVERDGRNVLLLTRLHPRLDRRPVHLAPRDQRIIRPSTVKK